MKENRTQLRSAEEMTDLERVRDWAKCGIYHNHSHNESKVEKYLTILDSVMESYTSQFKPSGVKTFTVEDMEEACRKQRELCFDAFWDYSCNNIHDEDGFRDAIKGAKEPDFKDVVRQSVDIDDFLQSYYGAPKPTGSMECEYDNLFNLLTAFKKRIEGRMD